MLEMLTFKKVLIFSNGVGDVNARLFENGSKNNEQMGKMLVSFMFDYSMEIAKL
jgi:hypothetical protein